MILADYEEIERTAVLSARTKLLRQLLGLSVEELAQEAGITSEEVIAAENCDISSGDKQFEIVKTFTKKYGANLDWLFLGKDNVFFERGPNVDYEFYKKYLELFGCVSPDRIPRDDKPFIPTGFIWLNKILNFFRRLFIKPTIEVSQAAEFEFVVVHTIICARIKVVREFLGVTVEELAREAGITPVDVIAVENGDNYNSEKFHGNTKIYEAMVGKYGVSMDRLIIGKGPVFLERGPKVSYSFFRENLELFYGVTAKHYPELEEKAIKPPKSPLPAKSAKAGKTEKREEYQHEENQEEKKQEEENDRTTDSK